MGKGDSKTAKGKRSKSSYGNARPHATAKAAGAVKAPVVKKTATKSVGKAPAMKVVAKMTTAKLSQQVIATGAVLRARRVEAPQCGASSFQASCSRDQAIAIG
jgi:ribosomal small subunit protein bTHX